MGTLVNVLSVILAGLLGSLFKKKISEDLKENIIQALGLSVIFIGLSGALKEMLYLENGLLEIRGTMMMVVSLVLGSLLGYLLKIDDRMTSFALYLRDRVRRKGDPSFSEGFFQATLVTCVGAMAIMGALKDGVEGDPSLLFTKSCLDFVIVLVFTSTYGIGAAFSALPLGLYQGLITLFSKWIAPFIGESMLSNINLVGSVIIFGIGVNLLFDKNIKLANMTPSLVVSVILAIFF